MSATGEGQTYTADNESEKDTKESRDSSEDLVNDILDMEKPSVTLDDVIGRKSQKDSLKECVIIPAKFPDFFKGKTFGGTCIPSFMATYNAQII